MQYEVRLKIPLKNESGLYQFQWGKEILRSKYEYATLLIEADNEEDLVNIVSDRSRNALSIISIQEFDIEERKEIELMYNLTKKVIPNMEIIRIVETKGIIICNN